MIIGQSCRWYFHKFAQITKSLTEQTSQLISLFWTMYSSFTILGKLFLALSFLIFPSQLVDSRTLMTIKSHANHAWQNTEHYHIKLSFIWMVTRYGFIKTLKWSKSTWWKLLTNGFRVNVHLTRIQLTLKIRAWDRTSIKTTHISSNHLVRVYLHGNLKTFWTLRLTHGEKCQLGTGW